MNNKNKICCEKCGNELPSASGAIMYRCIDINCPCHSQDSKCEHNKELVCRKCAEAVGEEGITEKDPVEIALASERTKLKVAVEGLKGWKECINHSKAQEDCLACMIRVYTNKVLDEVLDLLK